MEKKCPKCKTECMRDDVDVAVGTIYGPWGCPKCRWSEDDLYDLSAGQSRIDESGWIKDQYGGLHSPSHYKSPHPDL